MKFCTSCGKQLDTEAIFCSGCGAKQEAPAVEVTPAVEPAPAIEPTPVVEPAPVVEIAPAPKKEKRASLHFSALSATLWLSYQPSLQLHHWQPQISISTLM